MTAYSLRARLLALWVLLLTSAAATAYLMYGVYNQSTGVQVAQGYLLSKPLPAEALLEWVRARQAAGALLDPHVA